MQAVNSCLRLYPLGCMVLNIVKELGRATLAISGLLLRLVIPSTAMQRYNLF